MSRSGYSDDPLDDLARWICWRGAVKSAIRGKRGQAFLRELLAALDALPQKRLVAGEWVTPDGEVCALGAVGRERGLAMDYDPEDACEAEFVARDFGIAHALAAEIMFENDEGVYGTETPEHRFARVRAWAVKNLKGEQ